jgi:MinD-like ATPase involved in chromosome partitioning or flagellar assembly
VTEEESRDGRIITFYSYKGGTGRTMALANVGWLLASSGKRVLMIDWDLEAPGLHRYVNPFLPPETRELAATPGLIDFFIEFATAARMQHQSSEPDPQWYERSASLLRFALPVEWDFQEGGALDLVPAGRQDAAYALRVSSFDWQKFYDVLGGGLFLEAVKRRLREDYDYVLIDSRTGVSDTAGICTVQMPDDLVVLFTLNQQSIKGAYAIADSAERQRLQPGGKPSLRIWPVPTRIELAEKDRLDAARELAHSTFQRFVKRIDREKRPAYWGEVEVLYQPYYAYEEVLATFADRAGLTNTMLSRMEALANRISLADPISPEPIRPERMTETKRLSGLSRFERERPAKAAAAPQRPLVYISYSSRDKNAVKTAEDLVKMLTKWRIDFFWDRALRLGDPWQDVMNEQLTRASVVLIVIGKEPPGVGMMTEIEGAAAMGKRIVPVAVGVPIPEYLAKYQGVYMPSRRTKTEFDRLVQGLNQLLDNVKPQSAVINPEDPNKGRFGGLAARNGRELSASVEELSPDWFEVTLTVRPTDDVPLKGRVEFHLHEPTFPQPIRNVPVVNGIATAKFTAWGAFTVGAITDDGKTMLELDLTQDGSLPETFRAR